MRRYIELCRDHFDKEVCEECWDCKYYWRNDDMIDECVGQEDAPCHEYIKYRKQGECE